MADQNPSVTSEQEEALRREWYGESGTPEGAEADYHESIEIRRKDRTETRRQCLHQRSCADEGSFDWRERVPDETKPEKCVGRCLCEEFSHRVVTIECEFSLDADGTPVAMNVLSRTTDR